MRTSILLALGLSCVTVPAQQQSHPGAVVRVHPRQAEAPPPSVSPDVPQPPRVIGALPQLPDHGLPPIPQGPANGIMQPRDPESRFAAGPAAGAPCDVTFFVDRAVKPPAGTYSTIGEPSAAIARDTAFMTGNWYAALSRDSGMSWQHINPFTRFPAVDGGFCCDQRALHVREHDMTLWWLQYLFSATTNKGSVRIARASSRTNLANDVWTDWVFSPQTFGLSNGLWFDFPDIAHGNDHLYFTSNIFDASSVYQDSIVGKISLAELDAGGSIAIRFWLRLQSPGQLGGGASYRFTQGATGTMFMASHNNTSSMRVYRNAAGSADWVASDRNVASWGGGQGFLALAPNGANWAGRADSRITGGYANSSEYGFMWQVQRRIFQSRPMPYVRVARFRTSDHSLIGDTDVFNTNSGVLYPAVATNAAGHQGATVAMGDGTGTGTRVPQNAFRIVDGTCRTSFSGTWKLAPTPGDSSPTRNGWGDYFTVARHSTLSNTFVASGMSQRGGSADADLEPRFFWFGLESDEPTWIELAVEDNFAGSAAAFVTVAEVDLDGQSSAKAPFVRRYVPNQRYTLTAPAQVSSGGQTYAFGHWRLRSSPTGNFVDQPAGQLTLTVDNIGLLGDTAICIYQTEAAITVDARNATKVPIAVATPDLDGLADDKTVFVRRYDGGGLSYEFTAPERHNDQRFRRWHVGGVAQTVGARTVRVALIADTVIEAEYCSHTHGSYTQYGVGCRGSNGRIPLHFSNAHPDVGVRSVEHEVSNLAGATPAALFLGFSNTKWDGVPLPLSLGFIGADPSCLVFTELLLSKPMAIDALGFGTVRVPIANDVTLIGTHTYTQVIAVDLLVSAPLKIVVSNGLDMQIGGDHVNGATCR